MPFGISELAGGLPDILIHVGFSGMDKFNADLDKMNHDVDKAAQMVQRSVTIAAAAGAAIFLTATSQAAAFEKTMTNVNTILNLENGRLEKLGSDVLKIAEANPTNIDILGKALYDLASSGATAETSIHLLGLATQAASAGVASVDSAVIAGMATMNAYGLVTGQAAVDASELNRIYDLQFQTVNKGIVTFEQLSTAIGNVLPGASALKVPLNEMFAAIAQLTLSGIDPHSTTTYLNRLFSEMTEKVDKWEKFGAAIYDINGQFRGLGPILEDVYKKIGNANDATKMQMLGILDLDERGKKALLSLVNNYSQFAGPGGTLDQITNSTGAMSSAYEKQMNTLDAQGKIFKNIIQSSFIDSGNPFLELMKETLSSINKHPEAVKAAVTSLSQLIVTLGGFAAAYKTINLVSSGLTGLLGLPFGPAVLAIGALAAAIVALRGYEAAEYEEKKKQIDGLVKEAENAGVLAGKIELLGSKKRLTTEETAAFREAQNGLDELLAKNGKSVEDYGGSYTKAAAAIKAMREQELKQLLAEYTKIYEEQNKLANSAPLSEQDKIRYGQAASIMSTARAQSAEEAKKYKQLIDEVNNKLKELAGSGEQASAGVSKVTTATTAAKPAIDAAAEATKKLKEKNDELKSAGIITSAMLEEQIGKLEQIKIAYGNDALAIGQVNDKLRELYLKLGDQKSLEKYVELTGGINIGLKDYGDLLGFANDELVEATRNTNLANSAKKEERENIRAARDSWREYYNALMDIANVIPGLSEATHTLINGAVSVVQQFASGNIVGAATAAVTSIYSAIRSHADKENQEELQLFESLIGEWHALIDDINGSDIDKHVTDAIITNWETVNSWGKYNREQLIPILQTYIQDLYTARDAAIAMKDAAKDGILTVADLGESVQTSILLSDEEVLAIIQNVEKVPLTWAEAFEIYGDSIYEFAQSIKKSSEEIEAALLPATSVITQPEKPETSDKPNSKTDAEYIAEFAESVRIARQELFTAGIDIVGMTDYDILKAYDDLLEETIKQENEVKRLSEERIEAAKKAEEELARIKEEKERAVDEFTNPTMVYQGVDSPSLLEILYTALYGKEEEKVDWETRLVEFESARNQFISVQEEIDLANGELDDLYQKRVVLQKQTDSDIKGIIEQIGALEDIMAQAKKADAAGPYFNAMLYSLNLQVDKLTGSLSKLEIQWGSFSDTLSGSDTLERNLGAVTTAIEKIKYYGLDLANTNVDEQINVAIQDMSNFVATLNPQSQAYKDAYEKVVAVMAEFRGIGGVLDYTVSQSDSIMSKAQTGISVLQDELNALLLQSQTESLEIDADIEAAMGKLQQLEEKMGNLEQAYGSNIFEIKVDISQAEKKIAELSAQIANLNTAISVEYGNESEKEGGKLKSAHTGQYFPEEEIALIRKDEMVLRPEVTRAFGAQALINFNEKLDPSVLRRSAGGNNDRPMNVIVHNANPDTYVEISDRIIEPRISYRSRKMQVRSNPYV